jgi:hypothetical protein
MSIPGKILKAFHYFTYYSILMQNHLIAEGTWLEQGNFHDGE